MFKLDTMEVLGFPPFFMVFFFPFPSRPDSTRVREGTKASDQAPPSLPFFLLSSFFFSGEDKSYGAPLSARTACGPFPLSSPLCRLFFFLSPVLDERIHEDRQPWIFLFSPFSPFLGSLPCWCSASEWEDIVLNGTPLLFFSFFFTFFFSRSSPGEDRQDRKKIGESRSR